MVDVSEHYNHEGLVQQMREVKAVVRVLGVATEEILAKHNVFVGDVEQGMNGLMETSRQQYADMATLKAGCSMLEQGVTSHHERLGQIEHGFGVFRAEYGEKLDLIAETAQNFQSQVKMLETEVNAKIQKVEYETVPADLRRAHEGMTAELAKFRAEQAGGNEGKVTALISEALGSETFG